MNIGSGWSQETNDGKKYISVSLEGVFLEMHPELKKVKFALNFIPKEDRKKETSPSWRVSAYIPTTQDAKEKGSEGEIPDDEIPF